MLTRRTLNDKFPDLHRLLKTACNNRPDDYLAKRVELQKLISANSELGQVVILESGMDCDCVAFSNQKYKVDALPVVAAPSAVSAATVVTVVDGVDLSRLSIAALTSILAMIVF